MTKATAGERLAANSYPSISSGRVAEEVRATNNLPEEYK